MVDLYNVGTSTIWKYIAMVCEVLAIHDELFGNYISTFITQIMCGQLWKFLKISLDLQYIIGVIDGGHIPLFEKPNKKVITLPIEKKFHVIVLHGGM
jgi:hypothetical protein